MEEKKNDFWNNWGFKDLLQIVLIVVGFVVAYVKLEARVDTNKALRDVEMAYFSKVVGQIENKLDKVDAKLEKLMESKLIKNK